MAEDAGIPDDYVRLLSKEYTKLLNQPDGRILIAFALAGRSLDLVRARNKAFEIALYMHCAKAVCEHCRTDQTAMKDAEGWVHLSREEYLAKGNKAQRHPCTAGPIHDLSIAREEDVT